MRASDAELQNAVRAAGLRATRQRVAVLRAMRDRKHAMTAQELHYELRAAGTSPGLSTIYRTLTALADVGHLDTFQREGELAFRLCASEHHHHLVCEGCGLVEEVEGAEVEAWVTRTSRRKGFAATSHRADIYGRCRSCRSPSHRRTPRRRDR